VLFTKDADSANASLCVDIRNVITHNRGIMDCNVIATGIVAAVKETGLKLPLVVRLEGNNVVAGKKTLAESGLQLITGDSMADAARKVVKAVGK
jgi:succinyl-CoA synthetase beta subunit